MESNGRWNVRDWWQWSPKLDAFGLRSLRVVVLDITQELCGAISAWISVIQILGWVEPF